MSKKDYIIMAKLFNEQKGKTDAQAVIADLICGFCDMAQSDNPNFIRERFIAACQK